MILATPHFSVGHSLLSFQGAVGLEQSKTRAICGLSGCLVSLIDFLPLPLFSHLVDFFFLR